MDRSTHSTAEQAVAGALFALMTITAAGLGSLATSDGMSWYDGLERPAFTPPDATFGIVWTVLYVMIAVAGWLAWRATTDPLPTVAWAVQIGLNLAWTVVFFGWRSIGGGLVVIAALLAAAVLTAVLQWPVDRRAALLFVPYVLWIGFAAALNTGIAALK